MEEGCMINVGDIVKYLRGTYDCGIVLEIADNEDERWYLIQWFGEHWSDYYTPDEIEKASND
jgi:hypothetical protein